MKLAGGGEVERKSGGTEPVITKAGIPGPEPPGAALAGHHYNGQDPGIISQAAPELGDCPHKLTFLHTARCKCYTPR